MSLTVEELVLQRPDGVRLLGPLSLSLSAGERVALVGESGSGKSLLAQALFGVLPVGVRQVKGRITAFGTRMDLPSPGRDAIRGPRLAWVPQEPRRALNPLLTLEEHLALLPGIHRREQVRATLARLRPLLKRLDLPSDTSFLGRFPHQLSGGQRQRLCLAMALSCDPELLVLDEPTTALDPLAQRGFLDLLQDLQQTRGLGTLWITHDLAVASAVCDRMLVLYGGDPVEAGPVTRLLSHPGHPYTVRLLDAARRIPSPEAGYLEAPEARGPGCPFGSRCARRQTTCAEWRPWTGGWADGLRCEAPLEPAPAP